MASTKDWRTVVGKTGMTLCMALVGCQGQTFDSGADAGPGSSRAGGSFGGSSADAAGAFAVAATASAAAVCAGQCVDLSAQATGGVLPYSYAWDDGTPSATPSLHVCPDSTTTYSVVAHDASGSRGEISQTTATAAASVTLTVGTTCAAAASDAGATEIGQDAAPGSQVCIAEWPQPPYLLINRVQMATDAAGDTFVVVEYYGDPSNGSPTLNLGSPSPAYSVGLAVAKLDASYHLQWVREFGASDLLPESVTTVAVRTDAASEVTVLGLVQRERGPGRRDGQHNRRRPPPADSCCARCERPHGLQQHVPDEPDRGDERVGPRRDARWRLDGRDRDDPDY